MIPQFCSVPGAPFVILPPGIPWASLPEVEARFAINPRRKWLFEGISQVMDALHLAGCKTVYLDGSYVTAKPQPADFDGCWDPVGVVASRLDPVLLDFANGRAVQKKSTAARCSYLASGTGQAPLFWSSSRSKNTQEPQRESLDYASHERKLGAMITNERQYKITRSQVDKFRTALAEFNEIALIRQGIDPGIVSANRASLAEQLLELEKELAHYEELRSGDMKELTATSILELGSKLIEARIASGLSQRALAERLGIQEQQIQRYEQDRYSAANLNRLSAIADALHVKIQVLLKVTKDAASLAEIGEGILKLDFVSGVSDRETDRVS
jgi:DNA-binding XRE family transcriptional regulator